MRRGKSKCTQLLSELKTFFFAICVELYGIPFRTHERIYKWEILIPKFYYMLKMSYSVESVYPSRSVVFDARR